MTLQTSYQPIVLAVKASATIPAEVVDTLAADPTVSTLAGQLTIAVEQAMAAALATAGAPVGSLTVDVTIGGGVASSYTPSDAS